MDRLLCLVIKRATRLGGVLSRTLDSTKALFEPGQVIYLMLPACIGVGLLGDLSLLHAVSKSVLCLVHYSCFALKCRFRRFIIGGLLR